MKILTSYMYVMNTTFCCDTSIVNKANKVGMCLFNFDILLCKTQIVEPATFEFNSLFSFFKAQNQNGHSILEADSW